MSASRSSYRQLQPEDRLTIASLLQQRYSVRSIARVLGRCASTISREISRNRDCDQRYASKPAQQRSEQRRHRARPLPKLHPQSLLWQLVVHFLRFRWSPEVEDRQFPGHWEGDLIKGAGNASAVGTLVERTSRLLILVKLPALQPASAANVMQAFTDKLLSIVQPMRQSLTYDQGKEMALHKQLTQNTGMAVYFCDPHSPWQRGSNENTNGLVRQYLPKGTDLSIYSQAQLDAIADEINNRPRKGLGVRSPLSVYRELLINSPQHSTLIH